jgi:hypothetical protein
MKERLLEYGKEVEQSKDGQCYLWSFGQLVHFRVLIDMYDELNNVYEALAKMKKNLERNIAKHCYGLHVIYDNEEALFY